MEQNRPRRSRSRDTNNARRDDEFVTSREHARSDERRSARNNPPTKSRGNDTFFIVLIVVTLIGLAGAGFIVWRTLSHGNANTASSQVASSQTSSVVEQTTTNEESPERSAAEQASSSTEQSTQSPRSTTPATINLIMVGDVLMHDELVSSGETGNGYNFDFLFEHTAPYYGDSDLRILNQETVMGEPERGYLLTMGALGPIMNTPTALADSEVRYGFNTILKATNHTLDCGYSGLAHELDYWTSTYPNVQVIGVNNPNDLGTNSPRNYVDNVYIYEKDGFKVGILNYTWATNESVDYSTDEQVISYMSKDKVREDVEKARAAGAEMLIACPHWGIEYDTTPSEEEMTYSKLFTELGVDLILGSHPHILQRVEILKNSEGHKTLCYYSMGNYVAASLMDEDSLIGGVARVSLSRDANGSYSITSADLVPTVICHTYGPNMTAWPLSEYTDALAASSNRPNLTPAYAYDFCENVLGSGFNSSTGIYTVDLDAEPRLV
ncbi:MAG: CapA family protein [Coriobacteriales bacterium]|nr:CapA family protein [Coriobacteriales bacterium]